MPGEPRSEHRAAVLRHVSDAARKRRPEYADAPGRQRNEAERGAEQRRLAGAVGAEHADELALFDGERRVAQNVASAEADGDGLESERAQLILAPNAWSSASSSPFIQS